jgi:hypothetical protein
LVIVMTMNSVLSEAWTASSFRCSSLGFWNIEVRIL